MTRRRPRSLSAFTFQVPFSLSRFSLSAFRFPFSPSAFPLLLSLSSLFSMNHPLCPFGSLLLVLTPLLRRVCRLFASIVPPFFALVHSVDSESTEQGKQRLASVLFRPVHHQYPYSVCCLTFFSLPPTRLQIRCNGHRFMDPQSTSSCLYHFL